MTFSELQKIIDKEQKVINENPKLEELKSKLRNKPFWIFSSSDHGKATKEIMYKHGKIERRPSYHCCFNHIIGLPVKNGESKPIFDYERIVIDALLIDEYINCRKMTDEEREIYENKVREAHEKVKSKHDNVERSLQAVYKHKVKTLIFTQKVKHVAVLKAAGLGITELVLRFITWLCLKDDKLKGSQMVIFTGPRLELAVSLIQRLKDLFKNHGITFSDKETVLNLNGVRIEAFPSHHADSARGLPNVSLIFADECSFFPTSEQDNVMDIMLRNVPKSNPYLIAVSTPNKPGDLMDKIMKEPVETSPFKTIPLDWTYGINKIYDQEEIDKIKNSRSFDREFCLQFSGLIGNVFSQQSIENCQKIQYNPSNIVQNAKKSIGIDPSFGSSRFGIVATQFVNERIEVIAAEEHDRPDFNVMIDRIWELKKQLGDISAIYVDAANPEIWQSLKKEFNEPYSEKYVSDKLSHCKKHNLDPANYMLIVPVPFSTQGAQMLQHTKSLLEDNDNLIAIDKRFDKLLTSLRTAVANEYKLDKEQTSFHDILDAFRLSLQFYKRNK